MLQQALSRKEVTSVVSWKAESTKTLHQEHLWGVSLMRWFQGNICPGRQVLVLQSSWRGAEDTTCGFQGALQVDFFYTKVSL